jgi:hypothetical protein
LPLNMLPTTTSIQPVAAVRTTSMTELYEHQDHKSRDHPITRCRPQARV